MFEGFKDLFFVRDAANAPSRMASPENPTTSLASPSSWLTALFGGPAKSGAVVDTESTISLTSVWRAVTLISQSIAVLPFEVIEENEDGSIRVAKDHPLYYILRREPSPLYSTFNFLRTLVAQMLFFGNGIARIKRDPQTARPASFTIVDLSKVDVRVMLNELDELFYVIGNTDPIPARDIIHIQNLSLNGLMGLDVLKVHRDNFGLGLAARDFGNMFFNQGTFLSGYLSTPNVLKEGTPERISKSWTKAYGGAAKAGMVAILEQGMEYKPLTIKPIDAGMLDTQKFNIEDVARIFGVPMHLLAALDGSATRSNIEQLGQEFATYTAAPITENIEQEFSRKIFMERERGRFLTRLDLTALKGTDSKSRAEFYRAGIQNGWFTVNEVRGKEGLNPVESGDKNYIQLNMTTIDRVAEGTQFDDPAASENNNDEEENNE